MSRVTFFDIHLKSKWLIDTLDELLLSLLTDGVPLTEERIYELCNECLQTKKPQSLIRALGEAFTQPPILARCFQRKMKDSDNGNDGSKKVGLYTFYYNILENIYLIKLF